LESLVSYLKVDRSTRETCGVNVDKQDFNFNEVEDVESLPMKHFDNAFGTVLSAQTFAEVIFGL